MRFLYDSMYAGIFKLFLQVLSFAAFICVFLLLYFTASSFAFADAVFQHGLLSGMRFEAILPVRFRPGFFLLKNAVPLVLLKRRRVE